MQHLGKGTVQKLCI